MTQKFDEAWAIASKLPEEQQNAIAAIVQQLASEESFTEALTKFADLIRQQQLSQQSSTEVIDNQTQPDKIELPEVEVGEEKSQESENGEVLTLQEIYLQYPNEWVLIAYPELDENLNVIRGQVIAHSPERDELYSNLSLRKGKPLAIEYTGVVPDNIVVML